MNYQLKALYRPACKCMVGRRVSLFLLLLIATITSLCFLGNKIQQNIIRMDSPKRNCRKVFGLISDIQYADVKDGTNFSKTRQRFYRNSLRQTQLAVNAWRDMDVKFAVNLGDAIDGVCKRHKQSERAIRSVLDTLNDLDKPIYHIWGNHEYYNFNRSQILPMKDFNSSLNEETNSAGSDKAYYHFEAFPKLRIVALDTYVISTIGYDKLSDNFKQSMRILRTHNHNTELNSAVGLPFDAKRYVAWNGGVGEEQLVWLDSVLTQADEQLEDVIILAHIPLYVPASDEYCVCWDAEQVLSVLHKHPSVFAVFAGHNHDGGYELDEHNIHHITVEAVIETPIGEQAYATIQVTETGLDVQGVGRVPSRFIAYRRSDVKRDSKHSQANGCDEV